MKEQNPPYKHYCHSFTLLDAFDGVYYCIVLLNSLVQHSFALINHLPSNFLKNNYFLSSPQADSRHFCPVISMLGLQEFNDYNYLTHNIIPVHIIYSPNLKSIK